MIVVASVLLLAGSGFSLLAALGLLRFPDVYTRLHAAAKVGTIGAGLVLVGVGALSGDLAIALRSIVGLVFLILVSPISAHLLASAGLGAGSQPANITSIENRDNSP